VSLWPLLWPCCNLYTVYGTQKPR